MATQIPRFEIRNYSSCEPFRGTAETFEQAKAVLDAQGPHPHNYIFDHQTRGFSFDGLNYRRQYVTWAAGEAPPS